MARNTGQNRESINRIRGDNPGSVTLGYGDEAGISKALPGDQQAPWMKEPPFASSRVGLIDDAAINLATDNYQFTNPVSVLDWRVLILYIVYDVAAADDQLSIIPEFSMENDGDDFWPVGVINSNITQVDLADTNPGFDVPFGSRNMYPTELRTPALALNDNLRISLAFDVAPYRRYRFGFCSLLTEGTTGALELSYSLNM